MKRKLPEFLIILTLLAGCSSATERVKGSDFLASSSGMQKSLIKTDDFTLTAYKKITKAGEPVDIYIEGDGFVVADGGRISSNPTPRDPMVLRLSAEDKSANVAYLARPCQYTPFDLSPKCEQKFWNGSRFSEVVVKSMNTAIDVIKSEAKAQNINLIGYSGGAAIAVLVSARRNDVASIRTVAGNLDHAAINSYHKVDQLNDSLNPIDYAAKISNIPQYHFSGAEDKIVPEFIAKDFAGKSDNGQGCVKTSLLSNATHHKGWDASWPQMLALPVVCGNKSHG